MMKRLLVIIAGKHAVFVICLITFAFLNLTVTSPNYSQVEAQGQPEINTGGYVAYCNPNSKIGIDHPTSWDTQDII